MFFISRYKILFAALLSMLLLAGPSLADAKGPPQVSVRPLTIRTQIPSVYYGVHVPGWLNNLSAVTAFERDVNKPASIILWYQGWGLNDGTQNFETTWMNNVSNHGSIPLISWEPWMYTRGINQPDYSLANIIDGRFDSYITRWALASKAWGHSYFLRFAAEMNGNWYPWSEQVNGNQPGQYVQAFRHVHDIFTALNVTNVTWVWSPNVEYHGSTPLNELYPGSSYVDWIGMDGYNWSTIGGHQWQTFSQVFKQTYNDVLSMFPDKPLMVAETASAQMGGDKAAWISDAYGNQIPNLFPAIKAVIWFNENKETDWRVESSPATQSAFAKAIASGIYSSNLFSNLNVKSIPDLAQLLLSIHYAR